ncbi:MAG TPA: YlxR family protein, partial [Bacillales bacterium]|nr:YlxR family protein [Bacillales bacterium]
MAARVRKIPQRTCIGCQTVKNKKELIRIVRTPELEVLIDATGK